MSLIDAIQWSVVGSLAILAAASDLRTGRIPNALTLGAAAAGVLFWVANAGFEGLGSSLLGFVIGLAAFFPLFAVGGMGAGDVKLLAAFGAWLGPSGAIWAAIWGSLAGGVFALVVAGWSGYLSEAIRNVTTIAGVWSAVGPSRVAGVTLADAGGPRLAYAVPIGIGAVVALWFGFD
jgi:prepilin peptidase CpaA